MHVNININEHWQFFLDGNSFRFHLTEKKIHVFRFGAISSFKKMGEKVKTFSLRQIGLSFPEVLYKKAV